jgi:lipopolysaccharide/colanic/teichoic acid biosynthesis glycosyltransferase
LKTESEALVRPGLPRSIDVVLAGAGLAVASPVIAVAALLVRATSAGPAFFRQSRVGRGGRIFTLYKLRTMRVSSGGSAVTARGDERITPVGRFLRRSKLDELPQLWNVVRGDMALVGPRPEVPRYVDAESPLWRRVLRVRPGITDPVTLRLRDEEAVLAVIEGDPERYYREELQPAKLREYAEYLERRSPLRDLGLLFRTVGKVVFPGRTAAATPGEPVPRRTTSAEGRSRNT